MFKYCIYNNGHDCIVTIVNTVDSSHTHMVSERSKMNQNTKSHPSLIRSQLPRQAYCLGMHTQIIDPKEKQAKIELTKKVREFVTSGRGSCSWGRGVTAGLGTSVRFLFGEVDCYIVVERN